MDFTRELYSMKKHEMRIVRPLLEKIVNNVYIPKMHAKKSASYFYSGEND